MKSNLRMTIISRNIRAHLSRECHFSNHSTKRDQYSPEIIGTDSRSLQNWLNFRFGICGHPSVAHANARQWSAVGTNSYPDTEFSTRSMVQDYAEQQTIPAALLRASASLVSSRLNLLKPCQNRFRLRPNGNKPRMPSDTDLAAVGAHRRKLQSSHARCPETGLGHFR